MVSRVDHEPESMGAVNDNHGIDITQPLGYPKTGWQATISHDLSNMDLQVAVS
jgi:hypothetical protein